MLKNLKNMGVNFIYITETDKIYIEMSISEY